MNTKKKKNTHTYKTSKHKRRVNKRMGAYASWGLEYRTTKATDVNCTHIVLIFDSRMYVIFDFIIKYKCQVQISKRSNRIKINEHMKRGYALHIEKLVKIE